MISLILLRHPESTQDLHARDEAVRPDSENVLTERGQLEAVALSRSLEPSLRDVRVFCSPVQRCAQTAETLAETLGASIVAADGLAERARAARPGETMRTYRDWQELGLLFPAEAEAGDDSVITHRLKVETWLSTLLSDLEDEIDYVIVAPGAVIEALHSGLLMRPPNAASTSFFLCQPGHGHVWLAASLPDRRWLWESVACNVHLPSQEPGWLEAQREGLSQLVASLLYSGAFGDVDLPTPPGGDIGPMAYYIR